MQDSDLPLHGVTDLGPGTWHLASGIWDPLYSGTYRVPFWRFPTAFRFWGDWGRSPVVLHSPVHTAGSQTARQGLQYETDPLKTLVIVTVMVLTCWP